ncbi:MAG: HD domain-containing protein [Acidimicrobiales bacterium]
MPVPSPPPSPPPTRARPTSERDRLWAATMHGHVAGGEVPVHRAHAGPAPAPARFGSRTRAEREAAEHQLLAPAATRARGAGRRAVAETADPVRTCFERDRDRILHAAAFRRLAGKTQVFVFPADHQRTRLTHALEVAQVATAIADALGLNRALTEAIALGHDCGHGPGGHASEDAFTPYLAEGYDHAVWGADVVLAPLNLCAETLDGVRNHSWSRPRPATPEGEVMAWADRIAYVCHDFEDAVSAGIVTPADLPGVVRERCGDRRSTQINQFIGAVVSASTASGSVSMTGEMAEALAAFRSFDYERIYLRPASLAQAEAVIRMLRALVEHFAAVPSLLTAPDGGPVGARAGSPDAFRAAVTYVGGMTDRFACDQAITRLGWPVAELPRGVDLAG